MSAPRAKALFIARVSGLARGAESATINNKPVALRGNQGLTGAEAVILGGAVLGGAALLAWAGLAYACSQYPGKSVVAVTGDEVHSGECTDWSMWGSIQVDETWVGLRRALSAGLASKDDEGNLVVDCPQQWEADLRAALTRRPAATSRAAAPKPAAPKGNGGGASNGGGGSNPPAAKPPKGNGGGGGDKVPPALEAALEEGAKELAALKEQLEALKAELAAKAEKPAPAPKAAKPAPAPKAAKPVAKAEEVTQTSPPRAEPSPEVALRHQAEENFVAAVLAAEALDAGLPEVFVDLAGALMALSVARDENAPAAAFAALNRARGVAMAQVRAHGPSGNDEVDSAFRQLEAAAKAAKAAKAA